MLKEGVETHIVTDRLQQKAYCGAIPGVGTKTNILASPGQRPSCERCAKRYDQIHTVRE
jgi:hypothetical protein